MTADERHRNVRLWGKREVVGVERRNGTGEVFITDSATGVRTGASCKIKLIKALKWSM